MTATQDAAEPQVGRILIVDDNPTNLVILEELLDEFEIETAGDGLEALEKLEAFRPDIVVLDIMMPGMDGYDVCRRIRANDTLRLTKIIFVSAKAMLQERLLGYDAGGDDYVSKPFDHSELLAKVRVFLRLKTAEESDLLKSEVIKRLWSEASSRLEGILGLAEEISADESLSPDAARSRAQRIAEYCRGLISSIAHAGT